MSDLPATVPRMCARQEVQQSSPIGPIPTGFREIDTALAGGLQPGSLTVIAGYTGSGVTAFATHIARQLVTDRGGAANIESLDIPLYRLDQRIRKVSVPPAGQSYAQGRRELFDGRLRICGGRNRKWRAILESLSIELWTSEPRASLVVVDSLNMLGVVSDDLDFPRSPKMHSPAMVDFCRHLKGIAIDEKIAVVATTTFAVTANAGTQRADWIGHLAAIGPAAVAADNVLLLYRPDRWNSETPRGGEVDLVMAKGTVMPKAYTVGHQLSRGKFVDFPISR